MQEPPPALFSLDGISFGVISNGRRPEKLVRELDSIRALGVPELELLVAGDLDPALERELERRGARFLPEREAARDGRLGLMRNRLVEAAVHPVVVVADDDLLFHPGFREALVAAGRFDALAVRMLNPDGSRFWDYVTKGGPRGHRLLEYGEPDEHTYVTGGLIVARREVLLEVRWDEARGFYQDEDVDFSTRLRGRGYTIGFCQGAVVTHDDWRYTRTGTGVNRTSDWYAALRRFGWSLKRRLSGSSPAP